MAAFPGEGAEPTVIRVLVADDHVAVSMGLRLLISGEPDLQVVAMASDGEQAVALARRERPDVVVMDLTMPVLGGLEAARQMRLVAPGCRVLMLSGHVEGSVVRTAYAAGVWVPPRSRGCEPGGTALPTASNRSLGGWAGSAPCNKPRLQHQPWINLVTTRM